MCVGDQATRRERERARGRGVGSQECSIIWRKELRSLGRRLPVPPRGQVSKSRSRHVRPWRPGLPAPYPKARGPEAGALRAACTSLPALPVAPGCCRGKSLLLAASFRLSGESVNSTFLISESLEKRHSTAAGCTPGPRAPAPPAGRETPGTAAERSGGVGEAGAGGKTGGERGTKSKDPVRGKGGGHSSPPDPLATRRGAAVSGPPTPGGRRRRPGRRDAASRSLRIQSPRPHLPPGEATSVLAPIPFPSRPAPPGGAPRRRPAEGPVPSCRPRVVRAPVG